MRSQDYEEEYKRRLEMYRIWDRGLSAILRFNERFPKAENQPDPTRSTKVWDEETQSYVRVRVEVDSEAIDRGEA